jgi:hypothetical protein
MKPLSDLIVPGAQDSVEEAVPASLTLTRFPLQVPDGSRVELLLLVVRQQIVSYVAEERRPKLQITTRSVSRKISTSL